MAAGSAAVGSDASGAEARAGEDTRARILDAALACFLQDGYEQTTVARICARSGVANGTLFHHFPTKEAIADALYIESIASFQRGLLPLLERRPRSLRAGVRAVIAHQVEWIEANVDRARFVYSRGTLEGDSPGGAQLAELNERLTASYDAWLAPLIDGGRLRPISTPVLGAVLSGPTHALARGWLARQLDSPLREHVDELADAAYAAVAARQLAAPAPRRRQSALPPRGRMRLELVSDDGVVVGCGEAIAEIHAATTPQTGV